MCTGGILETTADLRAVVALAGLSPWDSPLAPLGEHLFAPLLLPGSTGPPSYILHSIPVVAFLSPGSSSPSSTLLFQNLVLKGQEGVLDKYVLEG